MRHHFFVLLLGVYLCSNTAFAQRSAEPSEPSQNAITDVTNTILFRWKASDIPEATSISYQIQVFEMDDKPVSQDKAALATLMNSRKPVWEQVQTKGLAAAWPVPENAVGKNFIWRVITLVAGKPRLFEKEFSNQFYIRSLTIKTDFENRTITDNKSKPGKLQQTSGNARDTVPTKTENQVTYNAPILKYPNQGASIKSTAIKNFQFSWLPVSPVPPQPVNYNWYLFNEQPGMQASDIIKNTKPVMQGSVKGVFFMNANLPADAPGKTYVWTVQATDGNGKGYGKNNGFADPFSFSVMGGSKTPAPTEPQSGTQRNTGCQIDFKILSSECIGFTNDKKPIYRFTGSLQDITTVPNTVMFYNDPYTFSCGNNTLTGCGSLTILDILKPTGTIGIINPVGFFPSTVSKTIPDIISWDFIPNSSISNAEFAVFAICKNTSDGSASGSAQDKATTDLPPCPCDYCTDDKIRVSEQAGLSIKNNILLHSVDISIPGVQVKQLKAELVAFGYYAMSGEKLEEQCYACNKDDQTFGNFTSGMLNAVWPDMTNGAFPVVPTGNTHHTLGWWGTPTTINNKKMILNISLPPVSTLSCCQGYYSYCIRYTFTDIECRTCSVVKCYQYPGTSNDKLKGSIKL